MIIQRLKMIKNEIVPLNITVFIPNNPEN